MAAASVSMWPASESRASEPPSKPGDDLDDHEAENQREGDYELAAVGVCGDAMRVSLVAPVRVGSHAAFTNVTLGEGR